MVTPASSQRTCKMPFAEGGQIRTSKRTEIVDYHRIAKALFANDKEEKDSYARESEICKIG